MNSLKELELSVARIMFEQGKITYTEFMDHRLERLTFGGLVKKEKLNKFKQKVKQYVV